MMNGRTSEKQLTNKIPLIRTEKVVQNLKQMPDGWAGNLSKKPASKAVRKIRKVLAVLEAGYMPWPDINVVANGGILLTWLSMTRDIMLTIDIDGDIQFATSLKKVDSISNEIIDRLDSEGAVTDMQAIDYMMSWFCSDTAAKC